MKLSSFFSNRHNQAILALVIANIIWGMASPIFKLALVNFPPFSLAFLRFFGAMLLIFPFACSNLVIARRDWPKLFLASIFGITINITFFFWGLQKAPSINAPIIASSGPIFLYLFSIFFLKEKPNRKILTGTFVSLLGVLAIVGEPLVEQGFEGDFLGNFFFVLATIGAVGHAIFSKEILVKYNAASVTFWSFFIGSLTFLPMFVYELKTANPFLNIDQGGLFGIFYGIVFSSALAYFLFEWGIKRVKAQEVGIFTYIDPVAAIILAIPLLGEEITSVFLVGTILIFLGLFLAEGRLHYHPFHKLTSR